jgi:REP element-mobilizing transposase RayT
MDDEFEYAEFPLAYLITIRCYGTWLHGDGRGSVDRHGHNVFGTPRVAPNARLEYLMRRELKHRPVLLSQEQRVEVEGAIGEVCENRNYRLLAVNARTNHVHAVVSARVKPEQIVNAFKSYATRRLRKAGLIGNEVKPWVRGKSTKRLWKPKNVSRAIDYVLYGRGDIAFVLSNDEDDDE